jgi:transposase-like protein
MSAKGRRFSEEFKLQVVQEILSGERQAVVARRHSVSVNSLSLWMKAYRSGRLGGRATGGSEMARLLSENRQLKELLGKKELELEFLKKAEAFARELKNGSSSIASGPGVSRRRKDVR